MNLRSDPLQVWGVKESKDNEISFVQDPDVDVKVLKISLNPHSRICDTYIAVPGLSNRHTLGMKLPVLVLLIKEVCTQFYGDAMLIRYRCQAGLCLKWR